MKCTICNGSLRKLSNKEFKSLPNLSQFKYVLFCTKHSSLTNNEKNETHYPNFFYHFNDEFYLFVWNDFIDNQVCNISKLSFASKLFIPFKKINIPPQHMDKDKIEMIFNFG